MQQLGKVMLSVEPLVLAPGNTLHCGIAFTPRVEVQLIRVRYVLRAREQVIVNVGTASSSTYLHTAFEEARESLVQQILPAGERTQGKRAVRDSAGCAIHLHRE